MCSTFSDIYIYICVCVGGSIAREAHVTSSYRNVLCWFYNLSIQPNRELCQRFSFSSKLKLLVENKQERYPVVFCFVRDMVAVLFFFFFWRYILSMVRATCVVEVSKLVLKPRDRSPWVEELTIKRLVKSQKYKEKNGWITASYPTLYRKEVH